MAKVWSMLTDGYSNEQLLTEQFINGVAWVRNTVHMDQLEAWHGCHVDRTTDEQPDALDRATKEEVAALCAQYGMDMAGKAKWVVIVDLRSVIGTVNPIDTKYQYSYELNKWLEANKLN